jgi:hypothetical protein
MTRTEKLRRICDRLVVESNRLDRVAEALVSADLPLESRQIKRWSRCIYQLRISLGELADDIRSPKGMKRRVTTFSGEQRP